MDINGQPVEEPKEQLSRWRELRSEFEQSWRSGQKLQLSKRKPDDSSETAKAKATAGKDSVAVTAAATSSASSTAQANVSDEAEDVDEGAEVSPLRGWITNH